jgi:hypothetical protein
MRSAGSCACSRPWRPTHELVQTRGASTSCAKSYLQLHSILSCAFTAQAASVLPNMPPAPDGKIYSATYSNVRLARFLTAAFPSLHLLWRKSMRLGGSWLTDR